MIASGPPTQELGEDVTDTILLSFPTQAAFRGVPSLVLGGVGSRLDLPYERTDDLQLAVLSMLDAAAGEQASVEIVAEEQRVTVAVGPLRPDADADKGLALVLGRLTDGVAADRRGEEVWLTVHLARAAQPQDLPAT